jgi:hypothetical protein
MTVFHQGASKSRFTMLAKEGWDRIFQVVAFNLKRSYLSGMRKTAPAMAVQGQMCPVCGNSAGHRENGDGLGGKMSS